MQPNTGRSGFMNEHQVAAELGLRVSTLRRWRLLNKGPQYSKFGSAVKYSPADLEVWINARPKGGERTHTGEGRAVGAQSVSRRRRS